MTHTSLRCEPIGFIRTPFTAKYGAPRQPATAPERSVGVITLLPGRNFEQALDDLTGFDYVWILYWFDRNTGWKPKVLPPDRSRTKRGVFATRSPHRPNPIGLSLCRLIDVDGRTVRIENPDMLDGTPVLDIKPYLPHAESLPDARAGWIAGADESASPRYQVLVEPAAARGLTRMEEEGGRELVAYTMAILARDPFPHAYRRIKATDTGCVLAVRRWRISFRLEGEKVTITRIAKSGH